MLRFWPSNRARKGATLVKAQERARTMPKDHRAKTVAWGLLRWGKALVTWSVQRYHARRRDMGYLQENQLRVNHS